MRVEKSRENNNRTIANSASERQNSDSAFSKFVDNRPQVTAQRERQSIMDKRATAQLAAFDVMLSGKKQPLQPVVQRQVLSAIEVDEDNDDLIRDVIIGGRSPSPFTSTMGAHSTAWVAHIDSVRRQLVNTFFSEGAASLVELAKEELESPLLELKDMLEKRHATKLEEAKVHLENLIKEFPDGIKEHSTQANRQLLQRLIDSYLTFVNYLPMATVKGGDPSGHGEGSARGDINLFEYAHANVKRAGDKELSKEFIEELEDLGSKEFQGKVKSGAKNKFAEDTDELKTELIDRLWMMFAIETPQVFSKSSSFNGKVWYAALQNFLKTIRIAYPYAFDFTEMHKVKNQIVGLKLANKESGDLLSEGTIKKIEELLKGKRLNTEAELRDDFSEVAESDLIQGGTGFQATLLLEKSGFIADVDLIGAMDMIGRTQSPFSGTMGAHTTAWVAHLDAVRKLLVKKSIPEALKSLSAKAQSILKDPSLKLSGSLDEKHQWFLIGAFDDLKEDNEKVAAIEKEIDVAKQITFLETYVLHYLTFLNFLPASTVSVGKVPGGRREGTHRNFLLNYEEYGEQALANLEGSKQEILQEHLYGLYDKAALDHFPPDLGDREETDFNEGLDEPTYKEGHGLYDFISGDLSKVDREKAEESGSKLAYTRFLETILEAYPRATFDSGILGLESIKIEPSSKKPSVKKPPTKLSQVDELRMEIYERERDQLEDLIEQNNCLINAIKKKAFGTGSKVTRDELLRIRYRVGEFGTMLYASTRVINIIREVLGIDRGIIVVYQDRPSEDFGNTDDNPVMIEHTGAAHFIPYNPVDVTPKVVKKKKPVRKKTSLSHKRDSLKDSSEESEDGPIFIKKRSKKDFERSKVKKEVPKKKEEAVDSRKKRLVKKKKRRSSRSSSDEQDKVRLGKKPRKRGSSEEESEDSD